ncbi:uncharacterized protein [Haliotis cracherodii]|uniref:uncharacterized protein n=1 Tax=Haliotis cracherodii TaxID=6455 RepID=UPI0039ED3E8D
MEDLGDVSQNSKKIEKLRTLLMKRPPGDFKHFMDGLEGEQVHIKDYIQKCLEKETNTTETDMMEDHKAMDQDTDVESDEQESTGSESGNEDEDSGSGHQLIKLKYLKTAEAMQHLAVRVTVVERGKTEDKSGKEQFMSVVADDTSAVDVCVRKNEDLFHKFIVGGGVILVNVDWSGNVLFANEKCTAITVSPIDIKQHVIDEAFGQGEAVPISKARTRPAKSFVALRGKVVQQSVLTKERPYAELLTHRQIKLEDRTGFVYVYVWGDVAVNLQAGDAIKITGCKIKKSDSVDDPEVTTTRKTRIQKLHKSEFEDIHRERRLERGTLEGINVKIFTSCTKPLCYHWKLDDNNYCESCACAIPDPVLHTTADVVVTTPRNKIRSLTVLWPQLRQLYGLFGKSISLRSSMSTLEDEFRHLQGNSVRYQTCGNVIKFRH